MLARITSLKNHQGFKKYLGNTLWLVSDKALRIILSAIVGLWTAKYLGAENFGVLSFAISFVGLFGAIAKLGLEGIVVRNLVRTPSSRDEVIGTSLVLRGLGSFSLIVFVIVALQFTDTTNDEKFIVFLVACGQLLMSFELIDCYFQSQVKGKYTAITNSVSIVVLSVVTFLLIYFEKPLIYFAFAVLIEQGVRSVAFLLLYFHYLKYSERIFKPFLKLTFKLDMAKTLLKDSWPLILAGVAIAINMRVDQLMLKEMLGNREVGIYAIAVRISEALIIIPYVITQSIYPSFVKAYEKDKQLFLHRIALAYRNLFYISGILALSLFFSAEFIVINLLGSDYLSSVAVLQVASFTIFFSSVGAINSVYLRTSNIQKKIMNRQWINVGLNIALNYFLIPLFGVLGAIYATLFSIIISTVIYDLFDSSLKEMNKAKLRIIWWKT